MSQYQIITDACADLPVKLVEELGVHVIPMSFNFGEESYTHYPDEREYTAKDFFDRLRNGVCPLPTKSTKQNSPTSSNPIYKTVWTSSILVFPLRSPAPITIL